MTDDSAHMSTQAVAALSELIYQYATKSLSNDLLAFSRHANRRTITLEDVLLMARKDPQLQEKLQTFMEREKLSPPKGSTSSKKKKKKDDASPKPKMTQRMRNLDVMLKKGIDSSFDDSSTDGDVEMADKPQAAGTSAHFALNIDEDSDDDVIAGKENQKQPVLKKAKPSLEDDLLTDTDDEETAAAAKPVAKKAPTFLAGGTKSGFSSDESDDDML